ncbi:RPA12/RPB9/RPC11 RNA polymerase family protein [Halosegnis sp.]|uniref:RPA12/RPB9/RPC11 RNA polymerase family protein n=1 Tax=Halosegnis sp. TaxID=2864959 RepID=UPI0035D51342
MQFCDECGSMMHADGDAWVCRSCGRERARDSTTDAAVTTTETQQDDGPAPVVDADDAATETVQTVCPTAECESERAHYEMMPKPGGSYEVRLFTCVECGHKWRN